MNMMPPAKLPAETPAAGSHIDETSTWRELAGQWLRPRALSPDESANEARRLAAVRRWRGLPAATKP